MNKIISRIISVSLSALSIWIILIDFWVGIFIMLVTYVIIHLMQFLAGVKITAMYDYFSQFYVNVETGKKADIDSVRKFVESDNAFNRKFKKAFKNSHEKGSVR